MAKKVIVMNVSWVLTMVSILTTGAANATSVLPTSNTVLFSFVFYFLFLFLF